MQIDSSIKEDSEDHLIQNSLNKFNFYYISFVLSIQDFGDGMPSDKLNHLFIDFQTL